ncbi:unnamed protein product, partial [Gulo gulo]
MPLVTGGSPTDKETHPDWKGWQPTWHHGSTYLPQWQAAPCEAAPGPARQGSACTALPRPSQSPAGSPTAGRM